MTEDDARAEVLAIVGGEALARLERLAAMVVAENERQNLIARSTVDHIWTRHILDSVQLLPLATADGSWLDVGTGGGFPGLALAAADPRPFILAEPRRRRATFLSDAAVTLGLRHVSVEPVPVERLNGLSVTTISARAVASVPEILRLTDRVAAPSACWLLPRGLLTKGDVEELRRTIPHTFHVEQSLSDGQASILVVERLSS